MNPVIDLGFISIHWYSIFIFIAIMVGGQLVIKESKRFGFSEDFIVNLLFLAVVFGIIGARAYFVLFNLDYYLANPIEILEFWKGGLAIHGGIIAALIFILIYLKKKKVNSLLILDFLVVGLIIGQAIGRWGNFFNGEAHGPETSLEFLERLDVYSFFITLESLLLFALKLFLDLYLYFKRISSGLKYFSNSVPRVERTTSV